MFIHTSRMVTDRQNECTEWFEIAESNFVCRVRTRLTRILSRLISSPNSLLVRL